MEGTSMSTYVIIIVIAVVAIFFINREFFMDMIRKMTKKSSVQQGYVAPVQPMEEPKPVATQVVQPLETPKPAPAEPAKPAPAEPAKSTPVEEAWTCSCGAVNTRKFCAECGEKRPEKKEPKCPACGYKPEEGEKIPKFCPECGAKME